MSCPVPWSQHDGDIPGEWALGVSSMGECFNRSGLWENPLFASSESMLWIGGQGLGRAPFPSLSSPVSLAHLMQVLVGGEW